MLNIKLYSAVPFQSNYNNVILFNNKNELNSYLETYIEGTINNIAQFFDGNNEIVLSDLYENCNYMLINDTNSTTPYKYYFIENYEFVSGGGVKYKLIMDVWATYSLELTVKNSLLIGGHLNVLTDQPNTLNTKRVLPSDDFGELIEHNFRAKYLTPKWEEIQNATIFVVCSTEDGSHIFFIPVSDNRMLHDTLRRINMNKFTHSDGTTWTAFKVQKVYIINGLNFKTFIDTNYPHGNSAPYRRIHIGYMEVVATEYEFLEFYLDEEGNQNFLTSIKCTIKNFKMFADETFDTKTNKIFNKYIIGTKLTNQEIKIDSELNYEIFLNMYMISCSQIMIYIEFGNNRLNVSNDFELPYDTDSYTLFMAQNQATIDANNKTSAISLATSLGMGAVSLALAPATAGASVMIGAGMVASGINYGTQKMKSQANLSDAKKQIDRSDGIYTGGLFNLLNGSGMFVYAYSNASTIEKIYNLYGTRHNYYIDNFKTLSPNLYNYYYIQFENINITGNFNNNIKKIFEIIFNNGVRIWCDKTRFLTDVNYLKN